MLRRVVEIVMLSSDHNREQSRTEMYEYGERGVPLCEIGRRMDPGCWFNIVATYNVQEGGKGNRHLNQNRAVVRTAIEQHRSKRELVMNSLINLALARDLLLPLYTSCFDLKVDLTEKKRVLDQRVTELDRRLAAWQSLVDKPTPEEIIRSTLRTPARVSHLCVEFFRDATPPIYWTYGEPFLVANNQLEAELVFLTDWIELHTRPHEFDHLTWKSPTVRAVERIQEEVDDLDEENEETLALR